jgi:hypothetical protein
VAPPAHVDHADLRPLHPLLIRVSCSLAGSLNAVTCLDWVWIVNSVSF